MDTETGTAATSLDHVREAAREIRKAVVRMHRIGTNVGSAMSVADILAVLYFDVMHWPSPDAPDRDRMILSKGHSVAALYGTLAHKGIIDREMLEQYRQNGSPLVGHPVKGTVPGIEASTGSLGHGLPIAIGMALAAKRAGKTHRIFVVMGDGECEEGSVWEGAMMAARLGLDNLTVMVDANGLQGYGRVDEILPRKALRPVFEGFGWDAVDTDGHDVDELSRLLSAPPTEGRPRALICFTTKGKGVTEMEDKLGWHYFSVPQDKLEPFLAELDGES